MSNGLKLLADNGQIFLFLSLENVLYYPYFNDKLLIRNALSKISDEVLVSELTDAFYR